MGEELKRGRGRPRGSVNKVTRAIREKAAKKGVMPADVMLDNMRYFFGKALSEQRKHHTKRNESLVHELRLKAQGCATDAAPYFMPKLATLQTRATIDVTMTLEALVLQAIDFSNAANQNAAGELGLIEGEVNKVDAAE